VQSTVLAEPIAQGARQLQEAREMRSKHQIKTTATLVLTLSAIAAPAAAANTTGANPVVRPNPDQQITTPPPKPTKPRPAPSPPVQPNPDQQPTTPSTANPATTIVRVLAPSHGFDWGDAGIGAAAGIALAFLGLGGALLILQRRARHTRASAAATN
jgi:hypothetical protein